MNRATRLLALFAAFLLSSLPALGQTTHYDGIESFESHRGPSFYTHAGPTLNTGTLQFGGGQTLTNSQAFGGGTVYASAGAIVDLACHINLVCDGCYSSIIISSEQFLDSLSFDIISANIPQFENRNITYRIDKVDKDGNIVPGVAYTLTGPGAAVAQFSVPYNWQAKSVLIYMVNPIDTNPECGTGGTLWNFAIDNVHWTLPRPRRLRTGVGTAPDGNAQIGTVSDDGTVDVNYALGLPFYLQVESKGDDGQWTTRDETITIQETTVRPPQKLDHQLFSQNHLLTFDQFSVSQYKTFQAVHTGDVTVTLRPRFIKNDPADTHPFDVHVHIVSPDTLGGFSHNFDNRIIALADESGIPPQYIKGQIASETGTSFNSRMWSYRPISVDLLLHQVGAAASINLFPYADYALREEGQNEGHYLCPNGPVTSGQAYHDCGFSPPIDDILPRYVNNLKYMAGDCTIRPVNPQDDLIKPLTIRELFNAQAFNDGDDPASQYGASHQVCAAPTVPHPRAVPHTNNDPLAVTAQTPLASRYGLLQVVPAEAISRGVWRGVAPSSHSEKRYNPSLLFDDANNDDEVNNDVGSLIPGVNIDVLNWQAGSSGFFLTPDEYYHGALVNMFGAYRLNLSTYGQEIVDEFAPACMPVSGRPLIPPVQNSSCGPVITSTTSDATTVAGGSVVLGVFTAAGSNVTGYHWYQGASGNTGAPVPNGDNQYVTVEPGASTTYWVAVTNSCGTTTSNTINVNVAPQCPLVSIATNPAGGSISSGSSFTLHAVASNAAAYQWYVGEGASAPGMDGDRSHPIPSSNTADLVVQPTTSTRYWVLATNGCGQAASATALVAVDCTPPSVDTQPQGGSIGAGESATLSVAASGTGPLTILWFTTMGVRVGEGASVVVTPVSTTSYFAQVINACGIVNSGPATVVPPCFPPAISSQSPAKSIYLGQSTTLTVTASGTPVLSIDWFTADGTAAGSGATILAVPTTTTTYHAHITNSCGSVDSGPITVTVNTPPPCLPPAITTEPASAGILAGQSATLTVAANATDVTYQWYSGSSGDTSSPIFSATSASYTVTPTVTTSYWVRVTASCGPATDSTTATVTICIPTLISSVYGPQMISSGQYATIGVIASGTNLSYQWYLGASGDTSSPLGQTTDGWRTLQPLNTSSYWVRVTGSCGVVDSTTVVVSVCTIPTITAQPQSISVFSGGTTTLTVTASASTPLSYQWYSGTANAFSPIPGATSASYTTPPITTDTSYWVDISAGTCDMPSDTATVSTCALPATMPAPPSLSIALGQTAHLVLQPFSPPTGNTFFWYQGASGDTSHPIGDFGGDWGPYNYIDVSPAVTTQYWAQIKNGTCVSNTGTATVSVCIPTITQQPASIMINSGQSATLTVAANTPGLTYQWYIGASGTTTSPISAATGASYTATPSATTSYWVRVTGSCGQSVNSNTATVTICQTPSITSQPAGASIVRGQNVTLVVSATGTNLSYQWYQGTSGVTTSPVGGNAPSFTVGPINPTDYWVKVTGTCGSSNSNTAHISVCTTPTINTQPQSSVVFSGGNATLTVSAAEATGEPMHYQWHRGTTSPVNVGTDSASYNTGALSNDTSYYVTITAGQCSVDSSAATVSICTYPQSVPGAPNQNSSPGQSVHLQIPANPGVTAYLWYRGASGDTSNPITGWQAANYIDVSPTTTTSYWARWQANSGSCISNTTTTTVSVCIPVITQQPANVTIASGSTTLSVVSNLSGSTYQWYVGASGTTTSPLSGQTSANLTVSPSTTTTYWCRVTGPCGTANSNAATVTICSPPVITHQPTNSASYANSPNTLAVTATGTNLTYQWYYGASGDTSNPFSGRTTATLSLNPVTSTQYWVRVTGTCGFVNSASAWMSVYPTIQQQPQQTTYLSQGSRGNLTVVASGTGLHYQWFGPSGLVGTDSPTLVTPDINAASSFYCAISSSGGAMINSYSGDFYLCDGVYVIGITVANMGGNCRNLTPNVYGNYDNIYWYQGARGDISHPAGSGPALYVCPTTATTYWFRATNTDQNQNVSCYTDSSVVTVP